MTLNGKIASEGTFEPCEKGTNDPAVQRPLYIFTHVSNINMPTFKIGKKILFRQESIKKALSDVTDSLLKASKNNNIGCIYYVDMS